MTATDWSEVAEGLLVAATLAAGIGAAAFAYMAGKFWSQTGEDRLHKPEVQHAWHNLYRRQSFSLLRFLGCYKDLEEIAQGELPKHPDRWVTMPSHGPTPQMTAEAHTLVVAGSDILGGLFTMFSAYLAGAAALASVTAVLVSKL